MQLELKCAYVASEESNRTFYTFMRCALALFRLDWADEDDEDAGDVLLLPL
jgi:hypothetical protein